MNPVRKGGKAAASAAAPLQFGTQRGAAEALETRASEETSILGNERRRSMYRQQQQLQLMSATLAKPVTTAGDGFNAISINTGYDDRWPKWGHVKRIVRGAWTRANYDVAGDERRKIRHSPKRKSFAGKLLPVKFFVVFCGSAFLEETEE
ncbi:hypothetical protein MRX96_039540 [Rhipicephalus microplus]